MDKEIEDKGTDVTDLAGDLEILEVAKSQLRMKNNLVRKVGNPSSFLSDRV
jgi:hypothetical protein